MSYLSEKNPSSASSYSYKYKSGTGKGFLLVAAMIYEMLGLCCPQCSFWLKLLMFRVDWRSVHHLAVISPLNKDWILSVAWGGWDLNLGPWNHHVHVVTTQPLPRHQRHQFASSSHCSTGSPRVSSTLNLFETTTVTIMPNLFLKMKHSITFLELM